MAVVHVKMSRKAFKNLAGRAKLADLEDRQRDRLVKELERGAVRHLPGVSLHPAELRALLRVPLLHEQATQLREAERRLEATEIFEEERDKRVRPRLEARRAQLQALA